MLLLLFELGRSRCAIDAARVVELLPLLELAELPRAPSGVAGAFSYHGEPVAVLDLCALALGGRAALRRSTRIALVRAGGAGPLVGLLVERATQLVRRPPGAPAPGIGPAAESPWPGVLVSAPGGLVHWIDVDALLAPALRAQLAALGAAAAVPAQL